MAAGKYDSDIAEIEAFLADPKTLDGGEPLWVKSARPDERQATWGILNSAGLSRGELRFRCPSLRREEPSISVIYRRRPIWRIDIVASLAWKPNPPGADKLGLPPIVFGVHAHTWPDNAEYARSNGFGLLPFRRPLSGPVRRLPQALAELAAAINVTLGPDQRGFEVPSQSSLFD